MNYYIELLNKLWKADEDFTFNRDEITLFTFILKTANAGRWKCLVVPIADAGVMLKFGIGRDGLDKARARLQAAGLLTFTRGNGRGNPAKYDLGAAVKVQPALHLSPAKGAAGATPLATPLSDEPGGKVELKVEAALHLSEPEAAPGAEQRPPNIKDTVQDPLIDANASIPSAGAADEPAKKNKGTKPKKEKTEQEAREAGTLTACRDAYDAWVRTTTDGFGAKLDGVQINALKAIIKYLRAQVIHKAELKEWELEPQEVEERIVETWQHVLDHTHLLGEWLQNQTRLVDFNSQFQNILKRVKQELSRKVQSGELPPTGRASGRSKSTNGRGGGGAGSFQKFKRNRGDGDRGEGEHGADGVDG